MGIRLSWALLAIVVIALFLGAMRDNTPLVEQAFLHAIYLGYVALTILALLAGRRWPGLLGFVVAGWAYFVPVFAGFAGQRIQTLPTTVALKSFVTTVAARPPVPAGSHLVTTVVDGVIYVKVDQPGDSAPQTATATFLDRDGVIQPQPSFDPTPAAVSAADETMINNAVGNYLGLWNRGVTIGHLLMTLLCSCAGAFLAIGFDRFLVAPGRARREVARGHGSNTDQTKANLA